MARSLGLAAYRALARRGEAAQHVADQPRPEGELVWIHAGDVGNLLAVQDLALRLSHARGGLNVLITLPQASGAVPVPPAPQEPAVIQVAGPSDHPTAVAGFLDHWTPDICVWAWGGLRPNLVLEAAERDCPLFLVDADSDGFDKRQTRWLPDLTRRLLSEFSTILARAPSGQKRLLQLGLAASKVEECAALLAGGQALGYAETDLTELASAMGGRPAWFAAEVQPEELNTVLFAHRQASRLSHRLLLILQTAAPDQADAAAKHATEQGLHVAQWQNGEFPDETTQVLISDSAYDRGLFYRVAPVCFLGTTLTTAEGGCDPLEAAALGSAILYGPRVRHFMPSYSRLAAAGAARIVNDGDALGAAVSSLIAPDHAAAMAHAGWDVVSQGAETADRIIDLIQERLDQERRRQ